MIRPPASMTPEGFFNGIPAYALVFPLTLLLSRPGSSLQQLIRDIVTGTFLMVELGGHDSMASLAIQCDLRQPGRKHGKGSAEEGVADQEKTEKCEGGTQLGLPENRSG